VWREALLRDLSNDGVHENVQTLVRKSDDFTLGDPEDGEDDPPKPDSYHESPKKV